MSHAEAAREDREMDARMERAEYESERRDRRANSCRDGFCGADDCHTCRPGNTWQPNEDEQEGGAE